MSRGPILIVEDDAGIRTMLELALAERGYDTMAVATVAEAVAAADRTQPSLVLLDVLLDGTDGLAFADAVDPASVPIVIMTASQDASVAAGSIGAAGFISKPFDLDDIYALAERYARSDS